MGLRAIACAVVAGAWLAPAAAAAAEPGPVLRVDAAQGLHAISPFVYGWNFAPADVASAIDLPVDRRGGNAADTLNWRTGVENHSNDFFFENIPACWSTCPIGWDPARAYTDQIDRDRRVGAKTLLDVPMLGYVPKDDGAADFNQPLPCSYPSTAFANQNKFDSFQDPMGAYVCGDGHKQAPNDSQWITGAAQLATATPDTPADERMWVASLVQKYDDAAHGGVMFYETGNEPGLWNSTHHDWHPNPTSATELRDDMLATAEQLKLADPAAQVIGPAEWGWPNYFCSAADGGCGPGGPGGGNGDWHNVQGDVPIIPWLLSRFKAYADTHNGQRLLDYVDVHYYRQEAASGIQGTRSLWDRSYVDQSWINDTIDLIPRMKKWAADYYPGTKTSLSEYDLAVDSGIDNTHIDLDNLIEADVLGIFGREGLDMATLWPETSDLGHYTSAFKLFRNYDGNKSKFGETSVSSRSDDQSKLAVYGAARASDGALTLVVINKTASDLTSSLALSNFSAAAAAQVWRFTSVASGIQPVADVAVGAGGFSATFPARSMSMVVIPNAGDTTPVPSQPGAAPGPGSTQPPAGATPGCVVPKLAGLTLAKATTKLRRANCRLGKVTKKHSRKRKGTVLAQAPRSGARPRAGTKVALVVSRGR